jgi:ubiquinone biosynthesis protein Coq4
VITESFAPLFLQTINDLNANPVHMLFNQWWQHAPGEVVAEYRDRLLADPEFAAFVAEGHYAEPLDLEALGALPAGSLGRAYRDWIVENDLAAQIATDYRRFHQALAAGGLLAGMPEELQYAVLRGFQLHDFLHVLTGYDASPRGELGLQAFCLAQLQFPYFAMWISTVTTRMTYVQPRGIVPVMDAITDGWAYGRRTRQLQFHRWEDELERPLAEVRAAWGIVPSPLAAGAPEPTRAG